ncbi:ileal sodium/bile acid cotransporter [Galendromus occidentalis]|uniref:Ileal sodium/bile acid cotransporter n=1 Tax=Galendromus occidentalis TaxID=34638 RepID=A0AAJ6VX72_9ACAR|nr:ileal sodium/bile acid cotransporter [Galendromus occidentalis]
MCPMLPITLLAILLFAFIELTSAASIGTGSLRFEPDMVQVFDGQSTMVVFRSTEPINENPRDGSKPTVFECFVKSSSEATAITDMCEVHYNSSTRHLEGRLRVKGDLIGHAVADVEIRADSVEIHRQQLSITVILYKTVVQHIFLGSVILLVSLNYVNMGCAIDMHLIKETLKKPIGPIVGLVTQFGVMPSIAYVVATNFLDEAYLKLGLFTFGCSPGGGASNMWTVLLGGNLDLSVTMTFISTIASLGFMPLWLFTAGKTFFKEAAPKIPFQNIVSGLVAMVIPLGVGLIMQRYCPKGTAFCRKILAPFSVMMIIFIVIFGTYANLYMFRLITWEIALATVLNVWTGFLIGIILARVIGLPWRDAIAVMVETGIQNTGVAIVLLGVSLPKPDGDMATIVPVAASTVTPIPLTILWLALRYLRCPSSKDKVRDMSNGEVKFQPIETA